MRRLFRTLFFDPPHAGPRTWFHGRISFSADVLAQPRRFREFVIVHELLHLKVPNHGKLFKSLLKAYLGNSRSLRVIG
ncbi:MAG: M48 family metallopeptidase [Lentisphaerae bacterium]|nr:M48 family metallopeptidase [Lentisphaerota bacterium]